MTIPELDNREDHGDKSKDRPAKRVWNEIVPGINPHTEKMYEKWDEIFGGENEVPLSSLMEPLQLPEPCSLSNDQQAQPHLTRLMDRLSSLNIEFETCEHYGPLAAYGLFVTEILPNTRVHPDLASAEIVEHFTTLDHCATCQAEFDSDFGIDFDSAVDVHKQDR